MKFSLIIVTKEVEGKVEGYWIQDHIGTIETATEVANKTSEVNSGQNIAVVDQIGSTVPMLGYWNQLQRLN